MQIQYGFSKKKDGNMSFWHGNYLEAIKNRRAFLNSCGINPENCVVMKAVHSDAILMVDESDKREGVFEKQTAPEADGLITKTPGLYLCLLTADCLPIIFYTKNGIVGLVHASWRATEKKIVQKMVRDFISLGAKLEDIAVIFGPAIGKCCYKFENHEVLNLNNWKPSIEQSGDKFAIDIPAYNFEQLKEAGVGKFVTKFECTYHQDKENAYFSHLRHKEKGDEYGQFMTFVGINPKKEVEH